MNQPAMNVQNIHQNGYDPDLPVMKVKRLSENAVLPSRATPQSSGYELSSAMNVVIPAGGNALVPTDLIIAVPNKTYGRIAELTGFSLQAGHPIEVDCAAIQSDYRGTVDICLHNHSQADFYVYSGDKIAQMILVKIEIPEVAEVSNFDSSSTVPVGNGFLV